MLERPGCVRTEVVFERAKEVLHKLADRHLVPGRLSLRTNGADTVEASSRTRSSIMPMLMFTDRFTGTVSKTSGACRSVPCVARTSRLSLITYISNQRGSVPAQQPCDEGYPPRRPRPHHAAMSQTAGKRLTYGALTGKRTESRLTLDLTAASRTHNDSILERFLRLRLPFLRWLRGTEELGHSCLESLHAFGPSRYSSFIVPPSHPWL